MIHLHFSGLPIDLQIMVLEPGVAKDHALLPEVRDGKEYSFRVDLVMEDYIHHSSTLNTGMGQEMFQVLIPFIRTKSLSMKLPVALESKSALTECTSLVSVVLISIGRIIDIL